MLPWCFQSAFEGNAVQSVSRTIVFEQCIPRAGFRITFPSCTAAGTNNSKCPVSQWCRLIDSHTHTVPVQTHTVYPWVHYIHWNNRRIHSVWSIGQNMHTPQYKSSHTGFRCFNYSLSLILSISSSEKTWSPYDLHDTWSRVMFHYVCIPVWMKINYDRWFISS